METMKAVRAHSYGGPEVLRLVEAEEHLGVALFERQVRQVSQEVGQLGETRLFLMGALLLADELADTQMRLSHALGELGRLQVDAAQIESRAAGAVDAAARKVEALLEAAG